MATATEIRNAAAVLARAIRDANPPVSDSELDEAFAQGLQDGHILSLYAVLKAARITITKGQVTQ